MTTPQHPSTSAPSTSAPSTSALQHDRIVQMKTSGTSRGHGNRRSDHPQEIQNFGLGCLRVGADQQEQAHHPVHRGKSLFCGSGSARNEVPEEGADLVLHAEPGVVPRWQRQRQHRAVHQSLLQRQLLLRSHQRRRLDSRLQEHQEGRRAELRLQHRGRGRHAVPLSSDLHEQNLKRVPT